MRIEALGTGDVASAVELVRRVLRLHPGDLGEQFASDITDDSRHMFVAKTNSQVIPYGRAAKLAAGEAAAVIPAGYYLSGVLVDTAWRGRGIATALTRARVRWVFAHADEAFYVARADNVASLHRTRRSGSRKSNALKATGPRLAWTCCHGLPERRLPLTSARSPATTDDS